MSKMSVLLLLLLPLLPLPLLAPTNAHSDVAKEAALMTKDLPDLPGKEGLVETAVLAPGELIWRIDITQMPLRVTQLETLLVFSVKKKGTPPTVVVRKANAAPTAQ